MRRTDTQVAPVKRVTIAKDSLGRSKGCATIEFASKDIAKMAMEKLHDKSLNGR